MAAEKHYLCEQCQWISPVRYRMWNQLEDTCDCPQCGAKAILVISRTADDPSFSARERLALRGLNVPRTIGPVDSALSSEPLS
jgi:rubredoxin